MVSVDVSIDISLMALVLMEKTQRPIAFWAYDAMGKLMYLMIG